MHHLRGKWPEYKKNLTLDAGNSGTLARLILGLLVNSKNIGDYPLMRAPAAS